ncbi:MAG: Methylamine utilization protein MauE [Mycobacteriales bacterium]|jgi:hypothetical protein
MSPAEVVLRAGLVTVFVLAAAGKAVALSGVAGMLRMLAPGLPERAARLLAAAAVGYEGAVALALGVAGRAAAPWVAAAAGLACCAFVLVSVRGGRVAGGVSCRCFGNLGGRTALGHRTIVRSVVLGLATAGWYLLVARAGPGVAAAGPRTALCMSVAGLAATVLLWRRLLPGVANRRFADEAILAQTSRPLVLQSDHG